MWTPRVTVASIVEHRGKFLMVEELIDSKRVFNQPAGHLENGESLPEAAIRETLEETGWHIQPQALVGIYRWTHPERQLTFLRAAFSATVLQQEPDRQLDKEIIQAHWLSVEEIRDKGTALRSPMVLQCLQDYLAGKRYPLHMLVDLP